MQKVVYHSRSDGIIETQFSDLLFNIRLLHKTKKYVLK